MYCGLNNSISLQSMNKKANKTKFKCRGIYMVQTFYLLLIAFKVDILNKLHSVSYFSKLLKVTFSTNCILFKFFLSC